MRSYKYNLELYKHNVIYCFDLDVFNKLTGNEVMDAHGCCHCKIDNRFDVVIYAKQFSYGIDIPVMAHECFHAADTILVNAGVEYDKTTTNEAFGYLVELLVRKGLRFWDKHQEVLKSCGK